MNAIIYLYSQTIVNKFSIVRLYKNLYSSNGTDCQTAINIKNSTYRMECARPFVDEGEGLGESLTDDGTGFVRKEEFRIQRWN